ncbi:MAG: hypothetical protein AAGA16_01480 [Cyanobacteria bacterium P01_E01_bin.35]
MLNKRSQQEVPTTREFIFKFIFQPNYKFWLAASILVAILFSLSGFGISLESSYIVQDDARQHVFWLQRLNDPELFNNDLIADYFSSVVPSGYKFVYWLANLWGLEPFLFNKILPLLLGIVTSIYMFLVTTTIFPVPIAGFLASLLLNQNLWLLNDLVSGTPRAFYYLLLLGFIYYLLRQQLWLCLLLIVLQSLFYPQVVLITAGILSLNLVTQKQNRYFYLIGLITAVVSLGIYKLQAAEFTDVITLETAKQLLEFHPGGRSAFFSVKPWYFWLVAERSGFFPLEWQYSALVSFGLLLPIISQLPRRFPLVKQLNSQSKIIWQLLITSVGLFGLAHLMLFRLHLPSRYSQHNWRIILALTAGITLTILLQQLTQRITKFSHLNQLIIIAIAVAIILLPTIKVQSREYRLSYLEGKTPELYQFLQLQPKDVVIATLSKEADFIPSLAQRTVLVSKEYSIPYHWDYYAQIRQRTKDLIQAQYSSDDAVLSQLIQKYHIDLWLVDREAFTVDYLSQNTWFNQFQPETQNAITSLQQRKQPSIVGKIEQCTIFQTAKHNLLDAQCLREQ